MLKIEEEVLKIGNFDLAVENPLKHLEPFKGNCIKGLIYPLLRDRAPEEKIAYTLQFALSFTSSLLA